MEKRREKITQLRLAATEMKAKRASQAEAAATFKVDTRELRDYIRFISGMPLADEQHQKSLQALLDRAYQNYVANCGNRSIRYFLEQEAPLWGFNPRYVTELWEVDSTYYPTGCPKREK